MDKTGGEVLLPPGGVLQFLNIFLDGAGHAVEICGQLANLVAAGHVGAGGVVALGQLVGNPAQTADGHGKEVGEEEHHRASRAYH